MENLLLSWGLSHTWSKIIPYALGAIVGFILFVQLRQRTKGKGWMKYWVFPMLVLVIPFSVYFALHPIYSGDFSEKGRDIAVRNANTTKLRKGLLVLSIPGCPYCMQSIADLKILKKRNPKLKIEFVVIGGTNPSALKAYKSEINGAFRVTGKKSATALTTETGGRFPAFIAVKNGKAQHAWTNDEFGVRAKDILEDWMN